MIQESEEEVVSNVLGDIDTSDFGIKPENLGMAYEAFIQYSNPKGSIVREITSNAWDATVEAGNNNPVVIEMSEKYPPNDEWWIAFKDMGTGLVPLPPHTPDGRKATRMYEKGDIPEEELHKVWSQIEEKIWEEEVPSMLVYKNFFSSTKRDIVDQLGYFGLGAKSPLGYTNIFEVITYRSGWKYHYTVRKGEEKPQLDLLSHEKTDRENGTTVRIPIATRSDWRDFVSEIETQLAYFDNVIFEGGLSSSDIDNDFKVYRGDHFIYRPDSPFETMHVCLGTVYYPLDFDIMDIREGYYNSYKNRRSGYHVPVGLYFPLEDQKRMPIKVVWNRESIEYNEKTKNSIEKKLEKAEKELKELYYDQYEDITTIKEWYERYIIPESDSIVIDENVEIPITDKIAEKPDVLPPGFEFFFEKTPSNPYYILEFHREVNEGYIDQGRNSIDIKNVFANPDNYHPIYVTDKTFTTKKNKWISSEVNPDGSRNFIILKFSHLSTNLGDPEERKRIEKRFTSYFKKGRDHNVDPTTQQLKAMLKFESLVAQYVRSVFRNYDAVKVSDSFNPKKDKNTKNKNKYVDYDPEEKFPLKRAKLGSYTWARTRWKYEFMKTLDKKGILVIYGYREDDTRLENTMRLFDNISKYSGKYSNGLRGSNIRVVKIAKSRSEMFDNLRNSYHVEDFWKSDHRIFRKVVTAFEIKDSIPDRRNTKKWKKYLPEAKSLYSELKYLVDKYSFSYNKTYDNWIIDLLNDKGHLVDNTVLRKLEIVNGYILKYPLLAWLERGSPSLNGLSNKIDLDKELNEYIEDRPPIHPHLLYRYKHHKNQQDNDVS